MDVLKLRPHGEIMDPISEPAVASRPRAKRFRSTEEKRRIVEETLRPGASVTAVARAHGVNRDQVFHWRKLYRQGRLGERSGAGAKLLRVRVAGAATFKYDPFGRRIQKVFTQNSTTTTTNYAYDDEDTAEEADQNGNLLAKYARTENIDEPLAESRSGAASYYETDGLGSISSLTSSAGAVANTYTYDSFGNLTNSSGSLTNPFHYTGREFDSETNLYYYRARYFDPIEGRFLSEDPLEFAGSGPDFYVYVVNRPVNWVDAYGTGLVCPAFLARWCVPPPPPPVIIPPPKAPYSFPSTRNPKSQPAPPSSWLNELLNCIGECYGRPIFYTSTSEVDANVGHLPDTPHGRGEAGDISYPDDPDKMLCCATQCGAGGGLDEKIHPSKLNTGPHIHVQRYPWKTMGRGDLPEPGTCCGK